MMIVRGAVVLVPAEFATSVMILISVPTGNGPRALPLASSGASFVKPASTPTTYHLIFFVVAWSPPPGT